CTPVRRWWWSGRREGGSRDKTQRETEEEKERHERARRGSDWRSMVGGRWGPKPGSDLSVVCSPPRAPHAKRDMDPGMACGLVWMGVTHAHQTQTNNEPQLLAPSLIRLLLPPPTGTRQDGERNHLWEVVFNILVTSTGRRFDWNLVPDMILAPSRHLQRLQSAKERQPAGRPSTLLKSASRGVVWSNSPDWPVVVEVLAGVRKQEIEGPGLEQGTICLEVSGDDTYRQVTFVKPQASE
ncbi:hypothetical protein CABS01_05344, partial [Colletotrichum abscissum]|uniref:uncharacterized protein n=1 Tax=Colletotrichum abscissum TaxID=1671311 RepID=UPI0027D59C54